MNKFKYIILGISSVTVVSVIAIAFFVFVIYLPSRDKAELDLQQQKIELEKQIQGEETVRKQQEQNLQNNQNAKQQSDQKGYADCFLQGLQILANSKNLTMNQFNSDKATLKDLCSSRYPLANP